MAKTYQLRVKLDGTVQAKGIEGTLEIDDVRDIAILDFESMSFAQLMNAPSIHPGRLAIGVLRVGSAVEDAETVSIGADVYEVDTHDDETITAGRIRLDLSGGSTVKAQGTLTIGEQVSAEDPQGAIELYMDIFRLLGIGVVEHHAVLVVAEIFNPAP